MCSNISSYSLHNYEMNITIIHNITLENVFRKFLGFKLIYKMYSMFNTKYLIPMHYVGHIDIRFFIVSLCLGFTLNI